MSTAPFPRGQLLEQGEYNINEFSRKNYDSCEIVQNTKDSEGPGSYMVTNLVPKQADAAKLEYVNPTLLGREGFGLNNAEVDEDSKLRNEAIQAGRQRCPVHVQARPFATVPFMGNGRGNPDVESALLYSEFARVERPCGTVTETFFANQFTPLVPHLANHVQNPSNLVPEVAASGWIRGGIPSRQFIRDLNC
jgi:hypothetical protein